MDTFRYWLMVLIWVSMPPALIWWFILHPFVGFWRRAGVGWAYTVILTGSVLMGWGLYEIREPFLRVDFGTRPPAVVAGAILVVLSGGLAFQRRKQLTKKILMGFPELAPERYPRRLLTEGLYARVRHPRYLEVTLGLLGYALVANYLAGYLVWAASVLALYLIVLMEERELADYFGEEYERYRRRVPRFIPRLRP